MIFSRFTNGVEITITEPIFNDLVDKNLFNEFVIEKEIDGTIYDAYAQSVPNVDSQDMSLVKYVLIFLVEVDRSYAADDISEVQSELFQSLLLIWFLVVGGFTVALGLIMLDVFLFDDLNIHAA